LAGVTGQKEVGAMETIDTLAILLDGFGWAMMAVVCAVGIACLYSAELSRFLFPVFRSVDYDGLDVEEIVAIEDARAELQERARQRAEKARQAATVARFEAFASLPFYRPTWEVSPLLVAARSASSKSRAVWDRYAEKREGMALENLASASIGQLQRLPGVGPVRARKIVEAGDILTRDILARILPGPVLNQVLAKA